MDSDQQKKDREEQKQKKQKKEEGNNKQEEKKRKKAIGREVQEDQIVSQPAEMYQTLNRWMGSVRWTYNQALTATQQKDNPISRRI